MLRVIANKDWGPSHQDIAPPFQNGRSPLWKIAGWYMAALLTHGLIDPGGPDPFVWSGKALVAGWLAVWFVRAVRDGRIPLGWLTQLTTESAVVLPAPAGDRTLTPGKRPGRRSPGWAAAHISGSPGAVGGCSRTPSTRSWSSARHVEARQAR